MPRGASVGCCHWLGCADIFPQAPRAYGHMTMAMHEIEYISPNECTPPPLPHSFSSMETLPSSGTGDLSAAKDLDHPVRTGDISVRGENRLALYPNKPKTKTPYHISLHPAMYGALGLYFYLQAVLLFWHRAVPVNRHRILGCYRVLY